VVPVAVWWRCGGGVVAVWWRCGGGVVSTGGGVVMCGPFKAEHPKRYHNCVSHL